MQSPLYGLGNSWQFQHVNVFLFLALIFAGYTVPSELNAQAQVSTNIEANYIVPNTLAYHLSTNIEMRTHGVSNIYSGTTELSKFANIGTNLALVKDLTWSTNFWLKNVCGLSATCVGFSNQMAHTAMFNGQGLASMVSPRHYLCATHMHPEGWGMIAFLGTNNVVYWRKTLKRLDAGYDTSVGILDADLPPCVGYLPVLPDNFTNYLPANYSNVVQGIGVNQDIRVFSQPMKLGGGSFVGWSSDVTTPYGAPKEWNVTIRGGDSSNPEMLLINNQLVLVSHNSSVGGGPNYAFEIAKINQLMHELSTNCAVKSDYQLTTISLTNWPTIN